MTLISRRMSVGERRADEIPDDVVVRHVIQWVTVLHHNTEGVFLGVPRACFCVLLIRNNLKPAFVATTHTTSPPISNLTVYQANVAAKLLLIIIINQIEDITATNDLSKIPKDQLKCWKPCRITEHLMLPGVHWTGAVGHTERRSAVNWLVASLEILLSNRCHFNIDQK